MFCDTKLISVFGLGRDLYFQSEGRFWRSPSNRFLDKSNYQFTQNNYQIHFESEFTALLESDDFDTYFPVIGFSFVAPNFQSCKKASRQCDPHYMDSGEYFRVCLYGKRKLYDYEECVEPCVRSYRYYYRPGGIARLEDKGNETDLFCQELRIRHGGLLSITSEHIFPADKNVVYALYHTYGSPKILRIFEWTKETPVNLISQTFKVTFVETEVELVSFISFYHFGIELFLGLEENYTSTWHRLKWKDKPLSFEDFVFLNKSNLFKLFNCPFKSGSSYVATNKEKVCPKPRTYSNQSVFTIGETLYHQIGQNFWAFDSETHRFLYDRDSSDLLNEYFDTTQRVTGFSFKHNSDYYEVMIHGKSAEDYEHLGEYISALFTYNESVPFLQVMNDPKLSILQPNVTLGKVIWPADGEIHIHHMSGLLLKVVGSYIWYWVREDTNKGLYLTFNDQAKINKLYNTLKNGGKSGHPNFKGHSRQWDYSIKSSPYERIVGIYTKLLEEKLLMVATDRKEPENMKIYEMGVKNIYGDYSLRAIDSLNSMDKYYHDNFCQSKPKSESHSESSSHEKKTTIFAILLIILLVLSLLISLFVYQKNRRKYKIQKSISNGNRTPKVETSDTNRANHTVFGQSSKNSNNSDVKKIDPKSSSMTNESEDTSVRSERI